MTYGWSILIIAVVLGVLFQLGVFSSASFLPRAQPGSCKIFRATGIASLEGVCTSQVPQYAAQFNGQSSYVDAGNSASLNPTSAITISAWINTASTGINSAVYKRTGANDFAYGLQYYNQRFDGFISTTGTSWDAEVYPATLYPKNIWLHFVITFNGINLVGYVNGVNVGSATKTGSIFNSPVDMLIGKASSNYFNGQIADIQIYNTSLDANQISALYLEGIGGSPIDPYRVVGWWPLNGDANDYSGNKNNGAAYSITYTGSWASGYTPP